MEFLNGLINQVMRQPAIFMGIIVLVGCMLRKLDAKKTLVSVIKTVVGMMILAVGSSTLIAASKPVLEIFVKAIGIKGVTTDMWTATAAALKILEGGQGINIGIIMISAWMLNLLLARFTPIKTVFLTGHVAYVDTVAFTFLLFAVLKLNGMALYISAIAICTINWWLLPYIIRPYLKPIIGDTPITLGHNMCISGIITSYIARLFGKPENSAEDLKLPGWLSIFTESIVSYSVIMGLIYGIIIVIAGPAIVDPYAAGVNYILYGVLQGFSMAVGINVLLAGVRMFLGELIPAFKGFSDRLIPGAIAAVDNPVFWPFAQTAALLGFVFTTIGQLVGLVLLVLLKSPVIAVPSVIPLFFGGCTLGVFANGWGGWKGVIGATFIVGIITIFGSAGLAYISNADYAIWGHSDWSTIWFGVFGALKGLGQLLHLI